jgi:hypothetical protein
MEPTEGVQILGTNMAEFPIASVPDTRPFAYPQNSTYRLSCFLESGHSRKDKSNDLVLVAAQIQKPAPTFPPFSSLLTPEEIRLFTAPYPFTYLDSA